MAKALSTVVPNMFFCTFLRRCRIQPWPRVAIRLGSWSFGAAQGHAPLLDAEPGEEVKLPADGTARLIQPFKPTAHLETASRPDPGATAGGLRRLWVAELVLPEAALDYVARHGTPIRYSYVPRAWPLAYYQTVFATEPGSAEMPSAGRPFTAKTMAALDRAGIEVARIVLHTGVSSLDLHEAPYPERFRVPPGTAAAVNRTHATGGRVIAVGTTVVRALESVASSDGIVHSAEGWTDLLVTAERGVHAVDALITGLHAPNASHLSMLEAFADRARLRTAYQGAIRLGYRWHEFGDSHLILA